ncbi:hypothetical protein [Pseudonocardia sp.]|uniref:hypothetical protein n=1 Tax=Pseudonocardia sp. TaxID=60912 RepID=UPI003D139E7D
MTRQRLALYVLLSAVGAAAVLAAVRAGNRREAYGRFRGQLEASAWARSERVSA